MVRLYPYPWLTLTNRIRSILYAPFIPFIVIFCHIIETSNATNDIPQLAAFVASLERSRGASHASEKLYQLCRVLREVAELYIEAKQQARTQEQAQAQAAAFPRFGDEIDRYLSTMGLIPSDVIDVQVADAVPTDAATAVGNPGPASNAVFRGPPSSAYLGEWFSANQHIMGLLEEDMANWSGAS